MFARAWIPTATFLLLGLTSAGSAQTDAKASGAATAEQNFLRAGDAIRLRIWREPDLSGEYPVDENGVVVFPKIGPQQVTGESPEALETRLIEQYQRFLRNPSIDLIFLRRVNVLGSVRQPGLFAVDPTMTVADALALAGGVMPDGRQDRIHLLREGEVLTANITHRTRIADLPIRSGDQLFVPERNWISRHSGVVVSTGFSLLSLLVTIYLSTR